MATTTGFKDIIDLPEWRPIAPRPNGGIGAGPMGWDMRNNEDRHPEIFTLDSGGGLAQKYNFKQDAWSSWQNPSLAGNGAAQIIVFRPGRGPRGTLAAGNTTTKVNLSTALPAAVPLHGLSNRGDGRGYKIRIVDNASGASGKIEERIITGNTEGTTPSVYLDSALSFTPTTGSTYEILSGVLYLGSSGPAWRSFDIATGFMATLNNTVTIGGNENNYLPQDELYVPVDRNPSEGFFGNLVATGSAAGTLTGQATGGDSVVAVNEYRNFQIRIVQDTAIPTAVGQRRRIASHTVGASPVYTLASNWTVTPSTTCTYVIEQDDDRITLLSNGQTALQTYSISGNSWVTTAWLVKTTSHAGGGVVIPTWALSQSDLGPARDVKHSYFYVSRGINGTTTLDLLDIAGGATGLWTNAVTYYNSSATGFGGAGNYGCFDPATMQGRYFYQKVNGNNTTVMPRYVRFDVRSKTWETLAPRPYPDLSVGVTGQKIAMALFIDGTTKLSFLTTIRDTDYGVNATTTGVEMFQLMIQR